MRIINNIGASLGKNIIANLQNRVDRQLSSLIESNEAFGNFLNNNNNRNYINSKLQQRWFGLNAMKTKAQYKKLYSYGAILQCNYAIYLVDVFNIQQKQGNIIWFSQDFPLSWLATEADLSLGGLEAEGFHAGSYQCNYITEQTADTMDVTFIETRNMDISKSYEACRLLATPKDGAVQEPSKYTFLLVACVFGEKRNLKSPTFQKSWLVAVKDGSLNLSSTGRSEIIKAQITFQKIRPLMFR